MCPFTRRKFWHCMTHVTCPLRQLNDVAYMTSHLVLDTDPCPTADRPVVHQSFAACSCSKSPQRQCCSAWDDPASHKRWVSIVRPLTTTAAIQVRVSAIQHSFPTMLTTRALRPVFHNLGLTTPSRTSMPRPVRIQPCNYKNISWSHQSSWEVESHCNYRWEPSRCNTNYCPFEFSRSNRWEHCTI